VHKSLWENIENLIRHKKIVICSEIADELGAEFEDYLPSLGCVILDDYADEIQMKVGRL